MPQTMCSRRDTSQAACLFPTTNHTPIPREAGGRTSRISEKGEEYNRRERSHSMTSTIGKGRHDDISDQVPARTSSLRHWSISSATPSNASSNSLPYSRHTADTSLDLSNAFSIKSSSRTSLNTTIANSPRTGKSGNFNIDDYISSDEDDFTTPRPRGEGEEELLFNDTGYGADGFFLPGLCHGLSSPSVNTQRPRSVVSMPSGALQTAYSGSHLLNRHGTFSSRLPREKRRYVLDTAADSDSDGGESDVDSLRDPRERRFSQDPPTMKNIRGTKRLSAIGTLYGNQYYVSDVIEEERLEKIDISAAVKLRKEIKARKREAQMTSRRAMMKGKQPMRSDPDPTVRPE
ncbi:hypothetical protein GQ53DRAFT_200559 [Thozetella sp. PMI_491]|nr:hypothetical protein GQ53DRAFT_200559 [Thozetella sp. PMI_491]